MHTIELSRKVRADEPVMIPAELLTEHVGTNIRILILPDETINGHGHDDDPNDELLAIVKRIQSMPLSPEHIKPATSRFTQEDLDVLLAREKNRDFDEAAWNARWDAYEAEMKEQERQNEEAFLKDMVSLLE